MRRLLGLFASRPRAAVVLTATCFLAVCTTHDLVQDLAYALQRLFGRAVFSPLVALLGLAAAALYVGSAERSLRGSPVRRVGRVAVVVPAVLMAASFLTLLSTNMEAVHFLQYGLLFLPLHAVTGRLALPFLVTALLGAADEWFQYAVLHRGWAVPYDVNDVVLNAIGAAAGVGAIVAFGDARPAPRDRRPLRAAWVPVLVAAAVFGAGGPALRAAGVLALYPEDAGPRAALLLSREERPASRWTRPDWGRPFYSLHPGVAVAACLLLAAAVAGLEGRVRLDVTRGCSARRESGIISRPEGGQA